MRSSFSQFIFFVNVRIALFILYCLWIVGKQRKEDVKLQLFHFLLDMLSNMCSYRISSNR